MISDIVPTHENDLNFNLGVFSKSPKESPASFLLDNPAALTTNNDTPQKEKKSRKRQKIQKIGRERLKKLKEI